MLFSVCVSEIKKLHRSPVWIAFFILPILAAILGTFNYLQSIGILTQQWYSLWTQLTLFSSYFFLPALIGVMCAYQWRLEHQENNWNSLMTLPVPTWQIIIGKLIVSMILILLTQVFTGFLFILSGKLIGLTNSIPEELPRWLLFGVLSGISIAAVQLLLAMIIRSFAIPVGISLMGGILGLFMTIKGLGLFWPYSLLVIGMNANEHWNLAAGEIIPYIISCIVFTIIPVFVSVRYLQKHDIEA
jgi:ABC-2 type transport system permease protein